MKPIIQQLLNLAETGDQETRLSCMADIYDYIEHPYPHENGYAEVVQQLILLLSKENDHKVRKLIVRNIEGAYMSRENLSEISFEPLISILGNADPFLIRSVLYLLSMTYNRQYIPIVETYLDHSDEEVRKEAQYILDTW